MTRLYRTVSPPAEDLIGRSGERTHIHEAQQQAESTAVAFLVALGVVGSAPVETSHESSPSATVNQVLEWNQVFIDTLIATNTANSSSQRLGAIVHTAIFDAYNGIEGRYTPVFVHNTAPRGASRRAAVIAAAHTALVGLFPTRQTALDGSYTASLEALSDACEHGGWRRQHSCAARIERGLAWGAEVAHAVLGWRATDGFLGSYSSFSGGTAVGQWRPTPPAFGAMSAQGLAFTHDVRPGQQHPVRASTTARSDQRHIHRGFQRGQGARSQDRIDAHRRSDGACGVLGRQCQRPLESGSKPDRAGQRPVAVRQPTDCSRS